MQVYNSNNKLYSKSIQFWGYIMKIILKIENFIKYKCQQHN